MSFDRTDLVNAVITNLGDAGTGVARSEIEEVVYDLVGDGINSFPKVAAMLAKFPKLSRRIGAVALLSVLKVKPDIFGAENAPYVRALNEAIESFVEGTGRALADVTEDDGRQMAARVTQAGSSDTLVHESVAHRGDGSCHKRLHLVNKWSQAYPAMTKRVGVGRDAKTVVIPGEPFPEIRLSLSDAIEQGVAPCLACMKKFIQGPEWAKPAAAPPKPKSFVESLKDAEREAFLALLMAVKKAKGANSPDWRMVERAKTREAFDKDLMRGFLKTEAGKPVTKDMIQAFLDIIDVDVDLSLVDYGKMVLTAFVGWVTGRHEIPRQVKIWGGIVVGVIGLVALIYLCVVGYGGYQFFVNGWYHGRFYGWVIGVAVLVVSLIPPWALLKRQRGLWLNMGASILFWGSLGTWIVCHGGGIQQRALLVAMAMATTFITVALTGLGEWTMLRRRTLLSTYLVSAFLLFIGSGVIFGKVESQFRPLEVRPVTVDGKTDQGVLTPNPYHLPEAHHLSMIFGKAAVDFKLFQIEKSGRIYSNEPLDILVPGVHARVREDGFGRYVYDWEPLKASQALALMESQGVIPDKDGLTMPDGQIVPKDGLTKASEAAEKIFGEKEGEVSATSSAPAQHMWGYTHSFWVWLSIGTILVGVLAIVFFSALDEIRGVWDGLRRMAIALSAAAVFVGFVLGACLFVDWIFGIGEPDKAEAAQTERHESRTPHLSPLSENGGEQVVEAPTPSPVEGRRTVDCSRVHDTVNHEACVRAMAQR